jgi:single-strand DNA-binding protein
MSGFSINRIILAGNLTRDPELRHTPTGVPVCNIGLAVNTRRKDGDEWVDKPNFFDVTVWSGMGEWAARSLGRGDSLTVEGRMEWRQYEHEGVKRTAYDVIADSLVPGERRSGGQSEPTQQVPADTDDLTPPAGSVPADDDIPF